MYKVYNFNSFFIFLSYLVVASGIITLSIATSINVYLGIFFIILVLCSWSLEDTKLQLTEKASLFLTILFVPLFFVIWNLQGSSATFELLSINLLSYLVVTIGIIKLFQQKKNRDWIFLYLISFFEVLLAAGSSVSFVFLFCFVLYILTIVSSIIAFELLKSSQDVKSSSSYNNSITVKFNLQLMIISLSLLFFICILAIPIFFFLPRISVSSIGNVQSQLGTVGYSNSIELGKIGSLQQNFQTVMRVVVEDKIQIPISLKKWRGIALDYFDNKSWRKSNNRDLPSIELLKNSDNQVVLKTLSNPQNEILQNIVLETIDSPTLFSLSNPIELGGNLGLVFQDSEGSFSMLDDNERVGYTVKSDVSLPSEFDLSNDNSKYSVSFFRYLQLPQIDTKIKELAEEIVTNKNAQSRYQKAKVIESYLQSNYAYTLDLKVTGSEPLADFLFDKKAGHCEYFATAMAVMLRTQGVATRIVNGFQFGEYNQTANVYVVKQKDAHSWVEVYFPQNDIWIPFDPTPSSGLSSDASSSSFVGKLSSYAEALETFWIQYFVSYDNKGQQSFFRKLKVQFIIIQTEISAFIKNIQRELFNWWNDLSGEKGFEARFYAIIKAIGFIILISISLFLLLFIGKKIWRLNIWKKFLSLFQKNNEIPIILFYERMTKALAKQGYIRKNYQTPLEFALDLNINEAVKITENYQRVRFGKQTLSNIEINEIETWLKLIEAEK